MVKVTLPIALLGLAGLWSARRVAEVGAVVVLDLDVFVDLPQGVSLSVSLVPGSCQ